MMQMEEKTLQLWEREPLQHDQEIRRMEARFADDFTRRMDSGNQWYMRKDLTAVERQQYSDEDTRFHRQWTRLIKLVTALDRHVTKEMNREHREYMREKMAKHQPAAEPYEMQQLRRQYIMIGEA
jgi:hypothetical protein